MDTANLRQGDPYPSMVNSAKKKSWIRTWSVSAPKSSRLLLSKQPRAKTSQK